MTLLWQAARIAAISGVLAAAFNLLPAADPEALTTFTIPTMVWQPIAAVLHLDSVFPISALLVCAGMVLARQVGMVALWLASFIGRHVFGG